MVIIKYNIINETKTIMESIRMLQEKIWSSKLYECVIIYYFISKTNKFEIKSIYKSMRIFIKDKL